MHTKNIITAGTDLADAKKAMILLHGRGGNAEDILGLANSFTLEDVALFALQATHNTWYPYSFLAPPAQNEPGLTSALEVISELVEEIKSQGIAAEDIYFCGFSQGACLTAEFVTRNADRYAGVAIFTGGLIGDRIYTENYSGDFAGTPVFIGTGNPDAHVPVERVRETEKLMQDLNAEVTVKVYDNRPHTISQDEIKIATALLF